MDPDRPDDAESGGYRSISRFAVAAAIAGAASVGCLVSPLFWIVPLVAIALAAVALHEIGRDGSVKVGRLPALAGLALAVGFGAQSLAHRAVLERVAAGRAAAAAREFIRATRESRFDDAREMCGPAALPPRRPGGGGSMDAAGPTPSASGDFAALPAPALLARCGGDGEATITGEPVPRELAGFHSFLASVPCGGEEPRRSGTAQVRVVVGRVESDAFGSGFDRWQVVSHEVVAAPSSSGTMPLSYGVRTPP